MSRQADKAIDRRIARATTTKSAPFSWEHEGRIARRRGRSIAACPYAPGTLKAHNWRRGWRREWAEGQR